LRIASPYYSVTAVNLVWLLLGLLTVCGLLLAVRWAMAARQHAAAGGSSQKPSISHLLIGFGTNFFDTLGIGSFATTTAAYRLLRLVPDELIPGTALVGHTLPVVVQALFFVGAIAVDPVQLTALIVACLLGGWLGAGVVSRLPRRAVQLGMGGGLLIAATFMLVGLFGAFPVGGTALALGPRAFILALAVNFALGALLTLGIGSYAPSLLLFSMLGMDPRAAFPIMMGAGAFAGIVASFRFIGAGRFDRRAAPGLALGGIPAVIIAAVFVQSIPLDTLRWLVLIVITYASVTLLGAGLRAPERAPAPATAPSTP
jgi:uncharacterized membrane protein YfcA